MKLSHVGFRLQRAVANRGFVGTLAAAPAKMMGRLSRAARPVRQFQPIHPFDLAFGTDTGGFIAAEYLLDARRKASIHNTGFCATAPSIFHQALNRLQLDHERFHFVDLGSGKGRTLLLASGFPFQRVVGVEFSPELHAIATRNIAIYQPDTRKCPQVECVLGDVRDFVFPPVPLVLFIWHAFVGPVFEQVMQNLQQSFERHNREVYLVYLKPELEDLVLRLPSIRKLWETSFTMSEEDFAAYVFPDQSERCAAYHIPGP